MSKLDAANLRILASLQADATLSLAEISEKVHLSQNACWNRIRGLEQSGVIRKRVAILDAAKMGAAVTVFVLVRAAEHSEEWYEAFARAVGEMPEVVEFYRTTGDVDYLLKLQLADIASYDDSYQRLIRTARCADVTAVFTMKEILRTTAVPIPQLRVD